MSVSLETLWHSQVLIPHAPSGHDSPLSGSQKTAWTYAMHARVPFQLYVFMQRASPWAMALCHNYMLGRVGQA